MLVENNLTVDMQYYFWGIHSNPLVYMSLVPVPHNFDYFGFVVTFEIRKRESFNKIVGYVGSPEGLNFRMNSSRLIQYIHTFSIIGYYKILNIVPCDIQ